MAARPTALANILVLRKLTFHLHPGNRRRKQVMESNRRATADIMANATRNFVRKGSQSGASHANHQRRKGSKMMSDRNRLADFVWELETILEGATKGPEDVRGCKGERGSRGMCLASVRGEMRRERGDGEACRGTKRRQGGKRGCR